MTAARLQRDAVTRAAFGSLAAWAWFLYGFGSLLPLIREEQGTSRTVTGLHSLALASGALVAGSLAVPVVRRLRRRGALLLGAGLVAAGIVLLCLGRSPLVTVPAVLLAGTGGSMVINAVTAAVSEHHGQTSAAAFSEANAVAAGVGLVAPLAVGGGVALGLGWRPAVLAVLPLLALLVVLVRRVPDGTPAVDGVLPARVRGGRRPLPGPFWLVAVVVVLGVGIEFSMTAWSADLLRERAGLSAAAASAGVTAVVGGMFAGRVALGRLALRVDARRLLLASFATTVAGWAVAWTSTAGLPALGGLALTGLGVAGLYPLGLALLIGQVPGRQDQGAAVLSLGIGLSSGLSPFALGALADATDTRTAFLVVPTLAVVAVALLAVSTRRARQTGDERRPPTSDRV